MSCSRCSGNDKQEADVDQESFAQIKELKHELGALESENARLNVVITTHQSEITSLRAQQSALRLANTQLVAEKKEVLILL